MLADLTVRVLLLAPLLLVVGCAGFGSTAATLADHPRHQPADYWVYVGTFTGPASKGIALFHLESSTGQLTAHGLAAPAVDPNFLALHPNGRVLYAAAAVPATRPGGRPSGAVEAFAIDAASGKLTFLNRQSSGGQNAVYVSLDPAAKVLLAANYDGPSVSALPVASDGTLSPASSTVEHQGSSVDPRRQKRPYPHSILPDPAGRFAFVPDLGTDKIFSYRLDTARGTLTPNDPPSVSVSPGDGPRHLAFHPTASFAYVLTEMTSTIVAFRYDAPRGRLDEIQRVSALPADFVGKSTGAEIKVHPSGRFLYASNRGHDSLVIFAIDPATGKLTLLGHQSTRGKTPRGFGIDPTGTFLIAGNQQSNSIALFRIDARTGLLTPEGPTLETPTPVSVLFVPIAAKP